MHYLKKFLLHILIFSFLIVTVIPQGITAANVIENFQNIYERSYDDNYQTVNGTNIRQLFNGCLSDGLFVEALSNYKREEFLKSWIKALKQKGLKDKEIISIINSWAQNHKKFFKNGNKENEKEVNPDVTDTVLKQNKSSLKGLLLKIKEFVKTDLSKFKTVFNYKYSGTNPLNLDEQTIKNMQSNIKYFPFIQFMLGFDLYGSFSTIFMQSNGYGLAPISLVMSLLAPISFAVSGIGGVIGDKISKRNLIIVSITVHALGTIFFALSGLSPMLLVASQVLPTIGISLLSLSLSPFLYESLNNLGEKDSFKEIYGSNMSLFWIIMSVSSLLGGAIAYLTSQFTVIVAAAIPDILITAGAFIFTHNEKIKNGNKERTHEEKEVVNKEKKTLKQILSNLAAPVTKLSSDKKTLSLAIINIVVNNIFFVVLCFFLQPALISAGVNVGLLAPVYFAANILQSVASHFIGKFGFITENKTVRTAFFGAAAVMFFLFVITEHPIFLVLIYAAMNFWQGTSSLTEVSSVYKVLDDNMKSKWLGFKAMFGTIISTITQISISGLLAIGISNNVIIFAAVALITSASILVPKIFDIKKKRSIVKNIEISTDNVKAMLSAA